MLCSHRLLGDINQTVVGFRASGARVGAELPMALSALRSRGASLSGTDPDSVFTGLPTGRARIANNTG